MILWVFGIVSWNLHKVWGNVICSFYSEDIDRLVDSTGAHDASRYSIENLEEAVDYVKSRYEEKGLCYFVLHHYLDRLVDILTSTLSDYYELYVYGFRSLEDAYRDVQDEALNTLMCDPKNVLTLTIYDLNQVLHALEFTYFGSRRRRSRKQAEERLKKANENIKKNPRLIALGNIVYRVLIAIQGLFPCVLFTTLNDESLRSNTLSKLFGVLRVKIASEKYRYGYSKLLDQEKLKAFTTYIMQEAYEECKTLQTLKHLRILKL